MTSKKLLKDVTNLSYNGNEMSLLGGVYTRKWVPPDNLIPDPQNNLTEDQDGAVSTIWEHSIWEILEHVAGCKSMYAVQAFGQPVEPFPEIGDSLQSLLTHLDSVHRYVVDCLDGMDDEALASPVPTTCHGDSAANLFLVMARHDVCHGAQIQMIRHNM